VDREKFVTIASAKQQLLPMKFSSVSLKATFFAFHSKSLPNDSVSSLREREVNVKATLRPVATLRHSGAVHPQIFVPSNFAVHRKLFIQFVLIILQKQNRCP